MSETPDAYKDLLQDAQCYARFLKDIGLEFIAAAPQDTVSSSQFSVFGSHLSDSVPAAMRQAVVTDDQRLGKPADLAVPNPANPQSSIVNCQSSIPNPQSAIANQPSPIPATQSSIVNCQSSIPSLPHLPQEDRTQRMAQIGAEVGACVACGLHAGRKHAVPGEGNPMAELMFIGEGPGFDEDRLGRPFVGRAGQKLDQMIAYLGVPRAQVYICNIVKCRPPGNRTPAADEAAACRHFLESQIETVAPRVICLLGATALKFLLGDMTVSISRMRGNWIEYRGVPVLPTFHPSYLLRDPSREDRLRAVRDMDTIRLRMQELGCRIGAKPVAGGAA